MAVQDIAGSSDFRIGSVISTALKIWIKNLAFFVGLGLLGYLPGLLLTLLLPPPAVAPAASGLTPTMFAGTACNLVFGQVLTAIITLGVFQQLRGRPIDRGACIAVGFQRFVPVLLTSLIATVLIALGMLLLVIPGIMLGLAFWVAPTSCVAENLGAIDSLKRSASLTKGYRWSIFGVALLFTLIAVISGFVIGSIAGVILTIFQIATPLASTLVQYAVEGLTGSLTAVVATCAYYNLRVAKEGVDIDQIAAVFD